MIGQEETLKQVDTLIEKGFPRFVIITGQKGQGKTELAIEISKRLKIPFCNIGIKIDEIREMIEMAYKQTEPIIYLIQNADKMSIGAKNSLLKVIEEPPNNAYIIMELQQMENTLDTIKSRCQEIKMDRYTILEINQLINKIAKDVNPDERELLEGIGSNYYYIDLLVKYNIQEFYDYVEKVYYNIAKVQSANSFKIAEKLDLKDTDEGYDLALFWRTYLHKCIRELFIAMDNQYWDQAHIISDCITITDKALQKLTINGINKQSLFDVWILDIRKVWKSNA